MRQPVPSGEIHPQIRAKGLERPSQPQNLSYTAPSEDGKTEVRGALAAEEDEFAGVGRNDKCPCGSGKKYKHVPRPPRRSDRPDRPDQLTRSGKLRGPRSTTAV